MDRLQLDLFAPAIAATAMYDVAVTPEVSEWLAAGAVCALGVSGGKDSQAMAIRLAEYLDQIGHKGPRVLIHSDLGVVEWKDSLPVCERQAKRLGWELIVLRRSAGDMMDRWEARWASSLERYATLSCVKIILPWSTPSVYDYIAIKQEALHEAYTVYGSTRVSCAFCIMGSAGDLKASASCPDNADIYRRMVRLEIASTFALQGAKWLGDVAPHLLTDEEREGLAQAKNLAALRVQAESRLPAHLLYTSGWPACVPTAEETQLIAEVRCEVADILGISVGFTTAGEVMTRYQELLAIRQAKGKAN